MSQRILPFYKTGWFYLLLMLWGLAYWSLSQGGFNRLNQFNLFGLFQSSDLQSSKQPVLRIQSSLTEQNIQSIEQLLIKSPNTAVLFTGQPSLRFIKRLQVFLRNHPRQSKVIIATENQSSNIALTRESNSLFNPVLSWFRELPVLDGVSQNNSNIIYSPLLLSKRNKAPMFLQSNEGIYLALMGEVIRQVEHGEPVKLVEDWQLMLTHNNAIWPVGFSGEVISAGKIPKLTSLQESANYLSSAAASEIKLLIFDGYASEQTETISRVAQGLLTHHYLYQTVPIKLIQYLVLFVGLYLLWFMQNKLASTQFKLLTAFVLLIGALQYFLATKNWWLEILPSVVIWYCSWGVLLAFQKEKQLITTYNTRYNQLLAATLTSFNQQGNITKLLPLLNQTLPDEHLVEQVFQLALMLEKDNKTEAAKTLFYWIASSEIAHKGTQQKIVVYRQHTNNPAINRQAVNKTPVKAQLENKTSKNSQPSTPTPTASKAQYQSPVSQAKPTIKHVALPVKKPVIEEEDDLEQTVVIGEGQSAVNLAATNTFKAEKFGRYQVEGILGKGAMGIVYQGVDPKINRHVAIKTLQLNDSADEYEVDEAKTRFFREAETAGNLSHANIVTIYDVGEEGSLGYIAMDLLTGAPLSHFIKPDNLLSPALVYQLMIQMADALEYAHKQNVVHRDIKPGNVIYDDDLQRVTVTDFGIAYVADNSKTRTGVIMGSPYYMSPEQVLGKQVDGRSDIFSLGATFYQLLSGCLPFEGDSVVSVVYQITNEKHKPVSQCIDTLPASATRITNKAMHKDIEKRYQTMQEFKQALINALKRDFKKAPII